MSSPTTTVKPSHRDIDNEKELDTSDMSSLLSDQERTLRFPADVKKQLPDVPSTTSYPDERKPPHTPVPSEKSPQSLFHLTLFHLQPPPLPNLRTTRPPKHSRSTHAALGSRTQSAPVPETWFAHA